MILRYTHPSSQLSTVHRNARDTWQQEWLLLTPSVSFQVESKNILQQSAGLL